jgi:hypothetical protein
LETINPILLSLQADLSHYRTLTSGTVIQSEKFKPAGVVCKLLNQRLRFGIYPFESMCFRFSNTSERKKAAGFTLAETLVAFLVLVLMMSGLICGYVQINRMADWSCMSLAAQSFASQGAERARAADWRPRDVITSTGFNSPDELPPSTNNGPVITCVDYMDIPIKGDPAATDFAYWITNYVWITNLTINPSLRKITSICIWRFPATGQVYTNTAILLRAPDQ